MTSVLDSPVETLIASRESADFGVRLTVTRTRPPLGGAGLWVGGAVWGSAVVLPFACSFTGIGRPSLVVMGHAPPRSWQLGRRRGGSSVRRVVPAACWHYILRRVS